jgi:hypothetical protein
MAHQKKNDRSILHQFCTSHASICANQDKRGGFELEVSNTEAATLGAQG